MEGSSSSFLPYRGSFPPRYWAKGGLVTPTSILLKRTPHERPRHLPKVAGTFFIEAFLRSKYPFLIELSREQHPLYVPVGYFALSVISGGLLRTQRSLSRGSSST